MRQKSPLYDYLQALNEISLDFKGDLGVQVSSICCDSRDIMTGDLFVAIKGKKEEGKNFIAEAISNGAIGVVYMDENELNLPISSIRVSSDYTALGRLAEFHYGYPSLNIKSVGITGTNGKTTTSFLLRHIAQKFGIKVGLIGSVQYDLGEGTTVDSSLTTPPPLDLQQLLYKMKQANVELLIMEVSSHALEQHRIGNMKFDVGVFTNLTGDHLDYHASMKNYYRAKKRMFTHHLKPRGIPIINHDDDFGKMLCLELQNQKIEPNGLFQSMDHLSKKRNDASFYRPVTYGLNRSNHCYPIESDISLLGTKIRLSNLEHSTNLTNTLIGNHNIYNTMAAVSAAIELEIPPEFISQAIETFPGVPGRLQRIPCSRNINIFIDFAHTDDALKVVLRSLRPLCKGKLKIVFGCGGNRDKSKRARMGKIASELADSIVITSDNPRFENPKQISREILNGVGDFDRCDVIIDRREAIHSTISNAEPDDTILIAGKGNETFQEVKNENYPFNDFAECNRALVAAGLT